LITETPSSWASAISRRISGPDSTWRPGSSTAAKKLQCSQPASQTSFTARLTMLGRLRFWMPRYRMRERKLADGRLKRAGVVREATGWPRR
jgi:hypothetical protein